MIAKNVVFVQDDDGHNYYIPKDKLGNWRGWLDSWDCHDGIVPDYAVRYDGKSKKTDHGVYFSDLTLEKALCLY